MQRNEKVRLDRATGGLYDVSPKSNVIPLRPETDTAIATNNTVNVARSVPFDAQLPLPTSMARWQDCSSSTEHMANLGDYRLPQHDPPSNAHLSRLSISNALSPSGTLTGRHSNVHMTATRSSEASIHYESAGQRLQYPDGQSEDAALMLQRTISMPSTLPGLPSPALHPMYQPATSSNYFALESPFSFMPASSEQSQHSPIDDSPHLASVSLPSSSGGLDALLNPPRTASHPTHLKYSMPYYKGGKRQGVTSSEHSSGFPNPYPRRASSPGTVTRHLRSPSPISSKRREGPSAYPLTYMPLTRAGISNFTLPLSNVDPKKARIEAEKGRRVELRDKFANLRDAIPMDGQKASKINILDRAISYIGELKAMSEEQERQLSSLRLELDQKGEYRNNPDP